MLPPFSTLLPKVVALPSSRRRGRTTALSQVEAYWTALAADGGIPARSRIDPRALENVLDQVAILERIAPGVARVRVAGSLLTDLAGMEPRGLPLSALFDPEGRTALSPLLEAVFDRPALVRIDLAAKGTTGQMILLPLTCETGRISRALAAFALDAPAPGAKLAVTGSHLHPVFGQTAAHPHPNAAEAPAPFGHAPHLRLVASRD